METIYHLLDIKPENKNSLKQALTSVDGLAGWWTSKTEQPEEGVWRFHFGGGYFKDFKVVAEDENHVEWKCIQGAPGWLNTRIAFDMMENDGKLMINFRHSDWQEQNAMFGICNYHWALYMKSLKELVETGKGNPTVPQN